MARMTRTQITLEQDQYRFLKSEAAQRGCSVSAIVREAISERMRLAAEASPHVWDLAGFIKESDISGKDHDRALAEAYGKSHERPRARRRAADE